MRVASLTAVGQNPGTLVNTKGELINGFLGGFKWEGIEPFLDVSTDFLTEIGYHLVKQ